MIPVGREVSDAESEQMIGNDIKPSNATMSSLNDVDADHGLREGGPAMGLEVEGMCIGIGDLRERNSRTVERSWSIAGDGVADESRGTPLTLLLIDEKPVELSTCPSCRRAANCCWYGHRCKGRARGMWRER